MTIGQTKAISTIAFPLVVSGEYITDGRGIPREDQKTLGTLDAVIHAVKEKVTSDKFSAMYRLSLQELYYVKIYRRSGNWWRFFLGLDRFSVEKSTMQYFGRLGLSTPSLVAHGYCTTWGVLNSAVMVTKEVANATNLQEYIAAGNLYRRGVKHARLILGKLADATRLMHQNGFYAVDLKPRNILVQELGGQTDLVFIDCPRGHHPPAFLFHHGRVKDLAHLYRDLQEGVRSVDLLWMFKRYLRSDALDSAEKQLAREVTRYYADRRMTRARKRRWERRIQHGSPDSNAFYQNKSRRLN